MPRMNKMLHFGGGIVQCTLQEEKREITSAIFGKSTEEFYKATSHVPNNNTLLILL